MAYSNSSPFNRGCTLEKPSLTLNWKRNHQQMRVLTWWEAPEGLHSLDLCKLSVTLIGKRHDFMLEQKKGGWQMLRCRICLRAGDVQHIFSLGMCRTYYRRAHVERAGCVWRLNVSLMWAQGGRWPLENLICSLVSWSEDDMQGMGGDSSIWAGRGRDVRGLDTNKYTPIQKTWKLSICNE